MAEQSGPIAQVVVGHINEVNGRIAVVDGDEHRALQSGDLVYSTDVLEPGVGASATLSVSGKVIPISDNVDKVDVAELTTSLVSAEALGETESDTSWALTANKHKKRAKQ